MHVLFADYLRSLAPDRRVLVAKHRLLDVALKVVGVGHQVLHRPVSWTGRRPARPPGEGSHAVRPGAVRAGSPGPPPGRARRYRPADHAGGVGQFSGLTKSPVTSSEYYVRQLHDMKYGVDIAGLLAPGMALYAEVCAWALARAHARSGDPAEIAGYLGRGAAFDKALARFAIGYADQTERDHAALAAAVRRGRLQAETGI